MGFKSTIKQLRENAGVSQQDVAAKIGIARATYAGLEAGRRDPNLAEIRSIAEFYQVSPNELIDGTVPGSNESVAPYKFDNQTEDGIEPREIDPKVNPEKLREVLLYVLGKIGAKPNIGETVLYKLLYFIDFDYYEKHGKSITGLTYIRNHFGPTPAMSFKEVVKGLEDKNELEIVETKFFNNTQKKYLPTKSVELEKLSAKELEHINEELARLSDKTASELSELSHYDTPWVVTKQGKAIDYRYVFYRTKLTAVTEPEDEL
jgi:transcriptional regulator with XRE-family HTH domain